MKRHSRSDQNKLSTSKPESSSSTSISNINIGKNVYKGPSTSSKVWSGLKDPRIIRVSRAFGGKDRHSKVSTVRGLRDRRVRLSVPTAIQLYDLQDRLGLNQPSKVVDWLLLAAQEEIDKLPPLEFPPPTNFIHHLHLQPNLDIASIPPTSTNNMIRNDQKSHDQHDSQYLKDTEGNRELSEMLSERSGNNMMNSTGNESISLLLINQDVNGIYAAQRPSSHDDQDHLSNCYSRSENHPSSALITGNGMPYASSSSSSSSSSYYYHWDPSNASNYLSHSGSLSSQQVDVSTKISSRSLSMFAPCTTQFSHLQTAPTSARQTFPSINTTVGASPHSASPKARPLH